MTDSVSPAVRRQLLDANPALSRFRPLSRIIAFDDFSKGMNGWTGLVGNYEDTLDNILPEFQPMYPPQLSVANQWDAGSHGAVNGSYSLKIATRPQPGALNMVLKRLTFIEPGPIQVEMMFAVKPEASELLLSDTDFRSFGIILDLQDPDGAGAPRRAMPHIKYLNASEAGRRETWQYKSQVEQGNSVGSTGATRSHPHFVDDGWQDIPGGGQRLCYNELPTKLNWHYLRLGVDLRTMRVTALQCNGRRLPVESIETMVMPAWPNLWSMLNICLFCESNSDKRCFLFVDSVLVSGDWVDA
ncbi:MAG TPA: DUF6772 family protein [Devosiaceae bacterium]